MRCTWPKVYMVVTLLLVMGWPILGVAAQNRWQGFYGSEALDYTASLTTPDIRAILEEDIPRILTSEERTRLAGVHIEFPREDSSHPLNFYSHAVSKKIVVPVSSLRFLRDMVVAYAWLSNKRYDLQSATDYLSMIKYQWPDRLQGSAHTPLEALGIPANTLEDPSVMERFQQLYGTMIVFILGHELGHIYYHHEGYEEISPEAARRQEQEADSFALAMMARMGETPVGAPFYFHILAHLEPFSGDPGFRQDRANRTHPLSTQRIQAIADNITHNAERYSAGAARSQMAAVTAINIADELRHVALILADEGVQEALRRIGLSTRLETLYPRRPGEPLKLTGEGSAPDGAFSGTFIGKWFDAKGTDLDVKMVLTRSNNTVEGSYILFTGDTDGQQHTYGSGVITMTGTVRGNVFEYEWHWGIDHFGRGFLLESGQMLSGKWGYNKAAEGAGTWQLHRLKN